MKRIALLSDTHNYLDNRILAHCEPCDEIWHAGDVGTAKISDALEKTKTLRCVYGNIDGQDIRSKYPETLRFKCEEVDVLMRHIAGRPDKHVAQRKTLIQTNPTETYIIR